MSYSMLSIHTYVIHSRPPRCVTLMRRLCIEANILKKAYSKGKAEGIQIGKAEGER